MTPIIRYRCDVCASEYNSETEAIQCESQGWPAPMPFLPIGVPIPAFGETRIEWAAITAVWVDSDGYGRHVWRCMTKPRVYLSHNRPVESSADPEWFDPRYGFDACRSGWTTAEVALWETTLKAYGFTEADVDPDVAKWIARSLARHGP